MCLSLVGAVGGVGIVVLLTLLIMLVIFAYFYHGKLCWAAYVTELKSIPLAGLTYAVKACVPEQHLAAVSEWMLRISRVLKVVATLFLLSAIASHDWITLYSGTADMSSSQQFGLFSFCSCTNCKPYCHTRP